MVHLGAYYSDYGTVGFFFDFLQALRFAWDSPSPRPLSPHNFLKVTVNYVWVYLLCQIVVEGNKSGGMLDARSPGTERLVTLLEKCNLSWL